MTALWCRCSPWTGSQYRRLSSLDGMRADEPRGFAAIRKSSWMSRGKSRSVPLNSTLPVGGTIAFHKSKFREEIGAPKFEACSAVPELGPEMMANTRAFGLDIMFAPSLKTLCQNNRSFIAARFVR